MHYTKQEQIDYQIDKLKYHFKRLNYLGALDLALERLKNEGIDTDKAKPYFDKLKQEKKPKENKSRFESLEL